MPPIPENQQHALVSRLYAACGGAYSPETRRKYYISGPQWAAAYQGQALFHAPTRPEIAMSRVLFAIILLTLALEMSGCTGSLKLGSTEQPKTETSVG